MNDIAIKYSLLDMTSRKEVNDFVDFLLSKQKTISPDLNSDYKERILTVSTWSEEDLKIFEENKNQFNNWKIEEW